MFYIFVSYLSLWNYSESFLQDSTRYLDAQNCSNISTFCKNFTQLKIFLVPRQCFSFFYLVPKEFFFLNKTNSCICSNWLKYYIKILTLILPAGLLYRSGGVRNYFLYKAPVYLQIKDTKRFGQNGLKVPTWEPWL